MFRNKQSDDVAEEVSVMLTAGRRKLYVEKRTKWRPSLHITRNNGARTALDLYGENIVFR